jgi:hypothetical protein
LLSVSETWALIQSSVFGFGVSFVFVFTQSALILDSKEWLKKQNKTKHLGVEEGKLRSREVQ